MTPRAPQPRPAAAPARPAGRPACAGGFALIAVLWVVLLAGLILLGAQRQARVNLRAAQGEVEMVRARWLARAGVEQALAVLLDDAPDVDGAYDAWYDDESLFRELPLAGGWVSVVAPADEGEDPRRGRFGLIDHAGLLDLNTADAAALTALGLDEQQAAGIIDWRDGDTQAQPGGAEGAFYARLPYPYTIRDGPFRTLAEVRLVRGIGRAAYLGEDADGDGLLDANEDDLAATPPDDDGDGRLARGLAGLATIYAYEPNVDAFGDERVNMNTADKSTLMERFRLSDALAEAITQAGSGGRPSGGGDGGGSGGEQGQPSGGSPGGPGQGQPQGQRFGSLMDLLNVRASGASGGPSSQNGGDEDRVSEITLGWLAERMDEMTLSDEPRLPARVNVNTAGPEVLLALPQMTEAAAERIVRRRAAGDGPFLGLAELLEGELLTEEQFKACAERLTVRGQVYGIRSEAVTRLGVRCSIVAVVDRGRPAGEALDATQAGGTGGTNVTILYWREGQ